MRGAHRCDPVGIEREAVSGDGDTLYDYGENVGCKVAFMDS